MSTFYQGASAVVLAGEVIYHVANKRRMEKVPLSGSKLPPSGNNGLGRAGFRRKNFRYSNSPTYIDFEANCPLNCKSTIDCSIYTLWSGNDVNGELAVSVFNASNLREIDTPQSTTFKKKRFQECFIARGILYCIASPKLENGNQTTVDLVYDIQGRTTVPVSVELPSTFNDTVSLQFSQRKSTLYGWSSDGTLRAYKIDFKDF